MSKESASTACAIEVRGLAKFFGEHYALRGVDLRVNRGERLVVFGPNGAGKTTLVKVLSTLVKPSAGSVRLDGIDIRDKPSQTRRRISLVSHETFLYDDLTVYENLRFYGRMYDVPDLEPRIREVVSWVRLEPRLHDRVGTLSHGLQQRASIARAVLHNPAIMFLDEPEAGLDPQTGATMRDVLGNLNSGSLTMVMTTHNLEQGLEMADRVIILDRGRVVYQAPRQEIDAGSFRRVYEQHTGASK